LRKQLHGGALLEGRDREFLFAINSQAGPAGGQNLETGACLQDLGHYRRGRKNLFEVIQEEQEWSRILQMNSYKLRDRAVCDALNIERFGESGRYKVRILDRGQPDKLKTSRELINICCSYCQGQARLSRTSWPGKSEQPDIVSQ
jgi:hypothetical protein